MSGRLLPVKKSEDIRRLKGLGLSDRQIASALKINRRTVGKYCNVSKIEAPTDVAAKDGTLVPWYDVVEWSRLASEIKKGVPIQVLWEELQEQKVLSVSYVAFWKQLRRRVPNLDVTMVRVFAPGDRCEIDYADGIDIISPFSTEILATYLFVGVLCHSRFIYAEFSLSQKSEDFLSSHVRMFNAFGGVPKVVSPDNLKSAVTKAHRYDPVINPAYTKLCDYYNTAAVPARVRKPKDKAIVERSIQIFQRWFYWRVRHTTFTSLAELNAALKAHVDLFNNRRHRVFRQTRFEMHANEKTYLQELPELPYEVSSHHIHKLHSDCHLVFDRNYYSAPHHLRGLSLDVWASTSVIEIYHEGNRVAFHRRCKWHGKYITDKSHYPESAQAYCETTPKYLRDQAAKIGPSTSKLIHELLSGTNPLRYLRRSQGIIRLAQKYSKEALELAVERAINFKQPTYQTIERILRNQSSQIKPESLAPIQRGDNPHLRGPTLFN